MKGTLGLKSLFKHCVPEKFEIKLQSLDHYLNGEPELRFIKNLCDKRKNSIDIGANIGTYTYFMRRYSAHVYAYEPNPQLAPRLKRLFTDVDVREKAVSNEPGELELKVPVVDGRAMHELGSIAQGFDDAETIEQHKIEVVNIDGENIGNVGFIKIDVEQNEIPVLQGALKTIRGHRPLIMVEATPLLYEKSLTETFKFVTDIGYVGWFTFENKQKNFSEFEPEKHANPKQFGKSFMNTNIFFIPEELDGCRFFK